MKELKFEFNIVILDELKHINHWSRLDIKNEGFDTKIVKVENNLEIMSRNNEKIRDEILEIEFFPGINFLSYSKRNSLYKITEKSLKELIKNEYKVIYNTPIIKYETKILVRKLLEYGMDVIPLDNKLYVKTPEKGLISLGVDNKYELENIE